MTDSTPIEFTTILSNLFRDIDKMVLTHIGFSGVEEESDTVVYEVREESTRVVHTVTLEEAGRQLRAFMLRGQ